MSDAEVQAIGRRIYIDIDDVLSQTLAAMLDLFADLYDRRVPYEAFVHFDMGETLGISDEQLDAFFELVHKDALLVGMSMVEGARTSLERWTSLGYEIHLLTGRPPFTEAATRGWLAEHALPHVSLTSVDKYGRATSWPEGSPYITLEDVAKMDFCLAVEDSLEVAAFLAEHWEIEIALIDQPWNRDTSGLLPAVRDRIIRCRGWSEVMARFPAP
jgi:uncharacterized HAD superfamily protein